MLSRGFKKKHTLRLRLHDIERHSNFCVQSRRNWKALRAANSLSLKKPVLGWWGHVLNCEILFAIDLMTRLGGERLWQDGENIP